MSGAPAVAGPVWLRAWFTAFASDRAPVSVGNQTDVWLRRGSMRVLGLPLRTLHSPTNEHTPRYDWPATLQANTLADWLAASRRRCDWDLLQLEFLAQDAAAVRLLGSLPKPWHQLDLRARWETPVIDLTQGADTYFATLSQKLRANTNRAENTLGRAGALAVKEFAVDADWRTQLDRAMALEGAGWKAATGGAIVQSDPIRDFYLTVLEQFRAAGALRLFGLTLDGELLAFNLLVRDGATWFGLKTGYAEAWAKQSPGNVLFRHVLKALFELGDAHSLDLLDPVTDWKRRWASRIESRMRLRLYAPSWRGRLAYQGERVTRWIYHQPAVHKLLTTARRSS